jgi:hypothetical protein
MYIYGMNDEETGIDSADRAASQHTDHRDDDGGLVGILTFKSRGKSQSRWQKILASPAASTFDLTENCRSWG